MGWLFTGIAQGSALRSYSAVRATGHKTLRKSLVNITVSVYDTTHLQENPQRIG